MKIIERGWEQTVDITVEAVPLGFNDLVAYRRIKLDLMTSKNSRKAKGADTIVTQGICKRRELSKLQRADELYTPHMLVEPAYLEEVQQYGYMTHFSPYFNDYRDSGSLGALDECISKTPYDDVVSGRFPRELIYVRNYYDAHMLFDENDQPFPVAMYFDYINGDIVNGRFDLDRVMEIVSARDDVENARRISIPYYNKSAGNSSAVEFLWTPSAEDYRRLWESCQELDSKFASTRMHRKAVWALDIFKLLENGTNLCAGEYENVADKLDDDYSSVDDYDEDY